MLYIVCALLATQHVLSIFYDGKYAWAIYDLIYILVPLLILCELFNRTAYKKAKKKAITFILVIAHVFYLGDYVLYQMLELGHTFKYLFLIIGMLLITRYLLITRKLSRCKILHNSEDTYLCYSVPKRLSALISSMFFGGYGHCFLVKGTERLYFKGGEVVLAPHKDVKGYLYLRTDSDFNKAKALIGQKFSFNNDCFGVFEGFVNEQTR